jgi:hypothetical protein
LGEGDLSFRCGGFSSPYDDAASDRGQSGSDDATSSNLPAPLPSEDSADGSGQAGSDESTSSNLPAPLPFDDVASGSGQAGSDESTSSNLPAPLPSEDVAGVRAQSGSDGAASSELPPWSRSGLPSRSSVFCQTSSSEDVFESSHAPSWTLTPTGLFRGHWVAFEMPRFTFVIPPVSTLTLVTLESFALSLISVPTSSAASALPLADDL